MSSLLLAFRSKGRDPLDCEEPEATPFSITVGPVTLGVALGSAIDSRKTRSKNQEAFREARIDDSFSLNRYTILNFQNMCFDTNQNICFVDGVKVPQFEASQKVVGHQYHHFVTTLRLSG